MIIFIYGADTLRSRRFRHELQEKFARDIDAHALNLSIIDGQVANLTDISQKLGAGSLFVKKRMVIIENIFKNQKEKIFTELADYLKKLPQKTEAHDDNIIIFHDDVWPEKPLKSGAKKLLAFLIKQDYSQEFKNLTGGQLLAFIKKEAQIYNKKISAPAAQELANRTGGDPWLIAGAIKKIAFSSPEENIPLTAVTELVAGSFDENIFSLTDALSAKNKKLAGRILEEQYAAGLEDEYILTMLIKHLKTLLQIRSALNSGLAPASLAQEIRVHPFVIKKGLNQIKNFSAANLRTALDDLIEIDWKNKTGRGNIRAELVLFLSTI